MALSVFLRSSACSSKMFSHQLRQLTTQSILKTSMFRPCASIMKTQGTSSQATPIYNAVRTFQTSTVRLSDEKPHDHAKLWIIEKATSGLLIPLVPMALLIPNKLFDSIIAVLIVAHSFWGLEAIAVDYVRASIFGPIIPKIAIALVYIISIATLGGLFYIITHDIGLANTIKQFWAIKSEQKS